LILFLPCMQSFCFPGFLLILCLVAIVDSCANGVFIQERIGQ
jgi:hypothetical protein